MRELRHAGGIADYLSRHFLDEASFARACGLEIAALRGLIDAGLVPAASYVVEDGHIASHVFGRMPAADAPAGAWYPRGGEAWVRRALDARSEGDPGDALKTRFLAAYREAMRALHAQDGPIPGYVDADGGFDDDAFDRDADDVWTHFLAGTYGLCVRDATDEGRIALKETLQLRLAAATDRGARTTFTPADAAPLRALIDRFLDAAMPFSPVEYERSSRRRLAADILARLPSP